MKQIRPFLDDQGRISTWPAKRAKQDLVLLYLSEKFEPDRPYTEREVNQIIDLWQTVGDLFLFRRGMVEAGFMQRTRSGSEYRRVIPPPDPQEAPPARQIDEPARKTPLEASYDVVVAGGGIAGIAAAIAAARGGASVALVEKECLLGGLATLGLITIYLPLCDGMGRQVIYGLGEELLRLSIAHGAEARYPDAWLDEHSASSREEQRFQVQFNPALFAIEAEKLLLSLGVALWYDARIAGVSARDGNIAALLCERKTGRFALEAGAFVDATGDADVCFFAGAPIAHYEKNRLAMWYYHAPGDRGNILRPYALPLYTPLPEGEAYYRTLSNEDITGMLLEGRRRILADFLARRESPQHFPTHLPLTPLVRMTRRLVGAYELDESEVFAPFEDSVGMTGDWRNSGPVFELPFRTLYTPGIGNLFAAGRLISVTEDMWDITRVIPTCAVTGEAAGVAAALCAKTSTPAGQMDVSALQAELRARGVRLRQSEL